MQIVSKLYNSSPKEITDALRSKLKAMLPRGAGKKRAVQIFNELQKAFSVYRVDNLKSMGADEFAAGIHAQLNTLDAEAEGYRADELAYQRDLSIKFHWGHNHDFGDFKLEGRMGDRHLWLLANFVDMFPINLGDFDGKRVFDIGCWTGGTSLLLAALGAEVVAIEEVHKYAEMTAYLAGAFGLDDRVSVESKSLYACNAGDFQDRFDIAYFPGVLYHLSDPVLALRILFNSLKIGGTILVESAGIRSSEPYCRFEGGRVVHSGSQEEMNRGGWNWFVPSAAALKRMLQEAGFDEVQTQMHASSNRVYGYGKKTAQVGISKAGLSVPSIQ
ncbi:MAG: tRNA 5-methoxyuridine(34)/uridine 5-oxyacetic acid(34) synthase CmoB [Anaerolineae bacterium]|nr:tRNA 5-methoxyuridine(34)/uridine 5-oxyacetic acid(34) synthase CmoB [Anaerolineae bacterium]